MILSTHEISPIVQIVRNHGISNFLMRMPSGVPSTTTCVGVSRPYCTATDFGMINVQELWPDIQVFVISLHLLLSVFVILIMKISLFRYYLGIFKK
jgi:hypothetical protein